MSALPQFRTTTELQKNYVGVLADLVNGPVYLLQRQAIAAVMVSPEEWERLQKLVTQAEHSLAQSEVEALLKAREIRVNGEPALTLEEHKTSMPERLAYLERIIAGDQAIVRNDFVTGQELAEEFAKMGIS